MKAPPPFAKGAPSHGPLAPGGGLLFAAPLGEPPAPAVAPCPDPPAPAFFGPLGGSLSKASSMAGPMPPLNLARDFPLGLPPGMGGPPPGDPPGPPTFPAPLAGGCEPPGPPSGLPPGLPPMGLPPGMPPLMGMPPPGFPPGMGPVSSAGGPLGGSKPSDGPLGPGPSESLPAQAPPGSPPKGPAAKPEVKKRKKGVEGLASNKSIKTGGAVTVYSGYDAMTLAPKEKPAAEKPAAPTQVTGPAAVTQALQRQLPDGWEMRKSRSTGKIYYVNEKLGKSQFEPPAGSTIDKKVDPKKKKAATRSKEIPDAQFSDRGGMMGMMRATEQKKGRWAKWQKCNELLNEPDPEEMNRGNEDDLPRWKGKGKGKGRRRDDDDLD